MTLKRWLIVFISSALVCSGLFVLFNAAVDPFGVFGDPLMDWYSYDMTQNPRVAKIAYLDKNYEKYDSYIIGCSKTSSLPDELLTKYYGADFYNMLMYGGDLYDAEKTAEYVIENYNVENLIVNIGLEELVYYNTESDSMKGNLHAKVDGGNTLTFYAKYLLANPAYAADKLSALFRDSYLQNENRVFTAETGAYDKSLRDIESIGGLDEYLAKYPEFKLKREDFSSLPEVDNCLASIERIVQMCGERGINFTLIVSPLYHTELDMYYCADTLRFFRELSDITPYWDFSGYTSVSYEPRYFYDYAHFRNCVGTMALARMFDDGGVYIPEDFGVYVTRENVGERLARYAPEEPTEAIESADVPVLLYHNISETETGDVTMTAAAFEAQIAALSREGYTAITLQMLIDYVEKGAPLPDKPLLITFDDGYESNILLAAPILEKYGMRATVFVIGVSAGRDTYKDTGVPITPHFSWEQAARYADVIEIQSHSYDMHRSSELDAGDYRYGAIQTPGESENDYIAAFRQDFLKSKEEIEQNTGARVTAYAYPHGLYTNLSEVLLSEMGVKVTLTTVEGVNTIVKGLPQSLYSLKRFYVGEETDPQELINRIGG